MSLLLYCVLRGLSGRQPPEFVGINGERLRFITAGSLSAAVSRVAPSELALNVARIIACEKIVARLHCDFTVVPLRYGCVMDGVRGVVRLLDERRDRFIALLNRLADRVEMGVRLLPRHSGAGGCQAQRPVESSPWPCRQSVGPGCDYLAAQRLRYAQNDGSAVVRRAFAESVCAAFAGLFVEWKEETRTAEIGQFVLPVSLFSLYFLVPAECLENFRKRFHEINNRWVGGLMLTGPWAPYNFVISEEIQAPDDRVRSEVLI